MYTIQFLSDDEPKDKVIEVTMSVSENTDIMYSLFDDNKENPVECMLVMEDGIITSSLPRRALNLVYEWLDLHQDELLDNWRRLSNFESPVRIDPLK